MKIAQVAAGMKGFHCADREVQEGRWALFELVLEQAHAQDCDLVLLPAGFWYVATQSEYTRCLAKIAGKDRSRLAVIGGIDADVEAAGLGGPCKAKALRHSSAGPRLPFFGFASSADKPICHWQQVSSNNVNCEQVRPDKHHPIQLCQRILSIGREGQAGKILALTCGEMHSRHIKELLRNAPDQCDAVVVSGHNGLGQGLVQSLSAISQAAGKHGGRCPVFHSQHLARLSSSLHSVDVGGNRHAYCVGEHLLPRVAGNWAAIVVHEI